jgi:phosphoribosylformylglycinamidine cyclo-ligase
MPDTTGRKKKNYTYRDSGVDIDKANSMLSSLKEVISSTQDSNVLSGMSSFCGMFGLDKKAYRDPVLASSTDGVGTKLILAKKAGDYSTVGQDLVAMSINDLICCGARPLFFLDYIACGRLDTGRITDVIKSIAQACRYCSTALLGGETAEMPDMYAEDEIDLAGFAVGIVDRQDILKPGDVEEGDTVAGILSSGLHSNGFSLVRKIIESEGLDLSKPLDWTGGRTLGKALLTPTKLYSPLIGRILDKKDILIKGIANITGGGFYDNINRIIPGNMDAVIQTGSWEIPSVFSFLQGMGDISQREMYKVFNMGIGMAVIISPGSFGSLKESVLEKGETAVRLGEITRGNGRVRIKGID